MSNVPVLLIEEIVSILVPALIFLFMNKKIFFSDENPKVDLDKHGEPLPHPKLRRFRRLVALMLLSPIGLFIVVFVVILLTELILNSYFIGSGLEQWFTDNLNWNGNLPVIGAILPFDAAMPASAKLAACGFMLFGRTLPT